MSVKTYTYCGPESLHSLIGQVMASLGYVGGRESRDVGAAITLRDDGSHLYVGCTFTDDGRSWSLKSVSCRKKTRERLSKTASFTGINAF